MVLSQVASGIGGQSLHQTKSMGCQEFHRRRRQEMSRHSYIKGYQRVMQVCYFDQSFTVFHRAKWPRKSQPVGCETWFCIFKLREIN